MATTTNENPLRIGQLVDIAQGGIAVSGIGRQRAINMIAARGDDESTELLVDFIGSSRLQPEFRGLAANGLLNNAGVGKIDALVRAAAVADAGSAPVLARGLGRLGGADMAGTIKQLIRKTDAPHLAEAEFGQTVLAYRHRLRDFSVRAPSGNQLQKVEQQETHAIGFSKLSRSDFDGLAAAQKAEPIGVDLRSDQALHIDCPPITWAWMWAGDASAQGLKIADNDKAVAGVLYRKGHFGESWSLSVIGLATPARGGPRLTLHRARSGQVIYAGQFKGGKLHVQSRKHPGLAAIDLLVELDGGAVTVNEAQSAAIALTARVPRPAPVD